jgi:predicted TIM-barrel fold metal-dependent hydrolase
MLIIDAHLHLDEKIDGTAATAAKELNDQLVQSNIELGIVLHLEDQPWSISEVSEAILKYPRIKAFVNVHPNSADAKEVLRGGIEELGYIGLKLHPRLQKFKVNDINTIELVKYAGELNVPVLIDAFPDGTHLLQGFSSLMYAELAQKCPSTKIIIAHMGGHHVLDFMMLAKRIPNIYFDFSYSLLYYRSSSISQNIVYSIKSMKSERIFYGSDYPDRSIHESVTQSIEYLKTMNLPDEDLLKVMGLNAQNFFKRVLDENS